MRLKFTKLLTLCLFAANLCLVYFTHKYFAGDSGGPRSHHDTIAVVSPKPLKPRDRIQSANRHIKKMVTIVFRDVYFFDNDIQASIESILALIPSIQIIVIYDEEPYPPLEFVANLTARSNVQFVSSAFDVQKTGQTASPLNLIRSRYVLLVPDAFRLGGRSILQKILKEIDRDVYESPPPSALRMMKRSEGSVDGGVISSISTVTQPPLKLPRRRVPIKRMLYVPFGNNVRHYASCCRMYLGIANWTLEYAHGNGTIGCDMYTQKHGIFIETSLLRDMAEPLATPFPEMLYLQAKIAKIQVRHKQENVVVLAF